jgi:gas vesicle protein
MRPWFTLTVIGILACCLLVFLFIVDFVLINREMFEMPFNITIRVPFTSWSHIWTEIQFMYILSTSILLGAAIVALTTLIFDTKRALKVRSMRKELARLQKALQEAQASMPEQSEREERADVPAKDISEEETSAAVENEEPVTAEEISHSFEDAVEQGDFLKVAQKRVEDELERHDGLRPEGNIRARVTGTDVESAAEQPQSEDTQEEVPDEDLQQEHDHETPSEEGAASVEKRIAPDFSVDASTEAEDASSRVDEGPSAEEEAAASDDSAESSVLEEASLGETESNDNQDRETPVVEAEIVEEAAGQEKDAPEVNEKETTEAKKPSDD